MKETTQQVKFVVGKTLVHVMKREINEHTGKEQIVKLHEGIVVQDFGASIRVFNSAPQDRGGDVSPETSEVFSVAGYRQWCIPVGERSVAFPIPPLLR
jgi:hypothetical protein